MRHEIRSAFLLNLIAVALLSLTSGCNFLHSSNGGAGGPPGGGGGAPANAPGTVADGHNTPATDANPWDPATSTPGGVPKDGPAAGAKWGNDDSKVFTRFEDPVVLAGTGNGYTVHQYDGTIRPDGLLSVLADFSIQDATVDSYFTIGLQGTDADGKPVLYAVRMRSRGTEVVFQGPHGTDTKKLQFRADSGDFYRMEIVFYRDAAVLYLGSSLFAKVNPSHTFSFPISSLGKTAQLNFFAQIYRGTGTVQHVELSRALPGTTVSNLPTLAQSKVLVPNGKLKTLTTSILDLSQTWAGYNSGSPESSSIDPNFYATTFDGAPNDIFFGTDYEWSYLGGRTTETRDDKKILRFHLNMLGSDGKYGRLALSGYDAAGRWYYHSLIFSGTQPGFLNYAPGYGAFRWINTFMLPNTDYVVDFVALADGTALYIYPEGAQPPSEPSHVFLAPLWTFAPQALMYHGAVKIKKFEVLNGGELASYPPALTALADDSDKHPSMWITRMLSGRYITYQRTLPDDFGVLVTGNHVHIAGTGDAYETYSTGTQYAREPDKTSGATKLVNKGLRFEFTLKDPNSDPILLLAIEGYAEADGTYRRHAIVVRNGYIYSQFYGGAHSGWGSRIIAGPGSNQGYDGTGTWVMKIEAYKDGSAIYLWKKGEAEPAEPEHVLLMSDWNVYNWRTWIWQSVADIDFSEYDLSGSSVLATYKAGDAHKTYVTGFYKELGDTVMQTTVDGLPPYDADGNLVLTGTGYDWSTSLALSAELSRARKFHVNIKLKTDTVAPSFSGIHFALHGYAASDPHGSTYRRHAALFWDTTITSQMYANGGDDWRGSNLSRTVKANTWYNVEFLGNRSGTALTVWEDGTPKPATPQSLLFSTDWNPHLNIWVYNGNATFKDLVVTHENATEDNSDLLSPYADFLNMTHQRYASIVDYMGPKYLPGLFSTLATPAATDTFTAIGNKDLAMDSNPCWQNMDFSLGATDASGFTHVTGDAQWYWEGTSCVVPLIRTQSQSQYVEFEMPALTYDTYVGLQGNAALYYYRRHSLRLTPAGPGQVRVQPQTYTTNKGWSNKADWGVVDAGGTYRLTMTATSTGSQLKLERIDSGSNVVGSDSFSQSDDVGATDWDPYFFTRVWSDDLKIKKVGQL